MAGGLTRFTIQLKFIYSLCQTLYSWPGRWQKAVFELTQVNESDILNL